MGWFSNHVVAFAFFWPAAVLGFLLPPHPSPTVVHVSGKFAGVAVLMEALALGLTFAHVGSSIIPFTIALSTSVASLVTSLSRKLPFSKLLFLSFPSSVFCAALMLVTVKHVMEKIDMAGGGKLKFGFLIPDAVAAALNGILIFTVLLSFSPLITVRCTERSKRKWLRRALHMSLAAGIVSSFLSPYSVRHPKRIFLNHLCRQKSDFSCDAVWAVASWDTTPIQKAIPKSLSQRPSVPSTYLDWITISPLNRVLVSSVFAAPPLAEIGPWGRSFPQFQKAKEIQDANKGTKRIDFELRWDNPGWGAMIITGPVTNWSLSDPAGIRDPETVVRFSQDAIDPIWPFWIEFTKGQKLKIQIGIYYPVESEQTKPLAEQFPEWTSVISSTSFVSEWTYN